MATNEEIKNALIGLVTFNGSSSETEAMASGNKGKIYVPNDEDVIIINKRRVGCGRNATTEKDGLMSKEDKVFVENTKIDIDDLQRAVGETIPSTYATKEELNSKLNATDAMVLAGTINGTGVILKYNSSIITQNIQEGITNISALTDYKAGWTWRVSTNGTISGIGKVESGDMVMCISNYNTSYKASDWTAIQRNIDLATEDAAGLMSADDKANLDAALEHLDGIDTKLNSVINGTTIVPKAEKDQNGNVIDETYALRGTAVATQDLDKYVPVNRHTGGTLAFPLATQSAGGAMSKEDKFKLDNTIKNRVGIKVPIIRPRGEGDGVVIPQLQNAFAYATARGGYVKVFYGEVEQTNHGGDWLCNGSNQYIEMGGQGDTPISIEIFNNRNIEAYSYVYVMFQGINYSCRTIECYTKQNNTQEWTLLEKVEDNEDTVVAFLTTINAGYFKFVFSQYKSASYFRPCEIGAASIFSNGGNDLFLPRNGGEIYGGIIPRYNSIYVFGARDKAWMNVYGKQFTSTAAEGTAPLVVSSKTMVSNLNAEMVGGVNADSIVYNKALQKFGKNYKLFSFKLADEKGVIEFEIAGHSNSAYFKAGYIISYNYVSTIDDTRVINIKCLYSYGVNLSNKVIATRRTTDNNNNTIKSAFDIWIDVGGTSSFGQIRILNRRLSSEQSHTFIDTTPKKVDSLPTAVYTSSWGVNLGVIDGAHKILGESSNAPLNVGNYFTPVYFLGGVPTACRVLDNNKNFGGIPYVSDAGYFPIGKYLHFHTTSDADTNQNNNLSITARDANDDNGEGLTLGGNTVASGNVVIEGNTVASGRVVIEGDTWQNTLRIKNKDQSNGEIYIYNGEQGQAVIRHYDTTTPTDLKFNAYYVWHGDKTLAYTNDVTALQTTIANLEKTVAEQATLIEALQSALTWE